MKNIILLGVPRAGKSTFAKMILKKFPNYNLIQEDVITSAYSSSFEEDDKKKIKDLDKDIEKFKIDRNLLYKMVVKVFDYAILYEPKLNFILDATDVIELEEVNKYDKNKTVVLVFGYPKMTVEEGMENVSRYDTRDDWTYIEPSWRIQCLFDTYIGVSKKYQKRCKKLGLKFVDTSYQREEVLNKLMEWLEKEIL